MIVSFGLIVTLTKHIAEFRDKNKKKIGSLVGWIVKIRVLTYGFFMLIFALFMKKLTVVFLKDASLSYLMLPALFEIFANFFGFISFIMSNIAGPQA